MSEGAEKTGAPKVTDSAGGTDGGWIASKPMKHRYVSPTMLTSWDGESAWRQGDPKILSVKEWGKQNENFKNSLRDFGEPVWESGGKSTWKHSNVKRWPLHRTPTYDREGVCINL
jgi:hypothetical protein